LQVLKLYFLFAVINTNQKQKEENMRKGEAEGQSASIELTL
jgi:hypothetical protein